jgi:apolipoprotein N-acyltransferase
MPAVSNSSENEPHAADTSRQTLALGLLGALLCYLAHPPVGWSLLAWVGPTPWLLLARLPRLPGRRPYLMLWLSGIAFWLAAIQWIRLPYWANIFGLFLLAGYLGAYLPLFVGLTRVAVHRLNVPLWIAAPVAWTGLEWLRARLLTGFLMASLAHTQVGRPRIIQIADVFGEYGMTFLIVLVAAAIAAALPLSWFAMSSDSEPGRERPRRIKLRPLLPAALALVAAIAYGECRLRQGAAAAKTQAAADAGPTIALIQSDMLADWKGDAARDATVMTQLFELSQQAVNESKAPVDLVVWPETMYRDPLTMLDPANGPPAAMFDAAQLDATRRDLAAKAEKLGAAILVGVDRYVAVKDEIVRDESGRPMGYRIDGYNSSALVDRAGKLVGTYDKMHLLPFGEFIPLVDWLPFLRGYSPITGRAIPGVLPKPINHDGVQYSVNICYETVLPHLIRRQFVHAIEQHDAPPDVMVNLTNDAWYWGSSELDMHLASGVFRAVEMRTPLVISANRGLSAYVDYLGRVVQVTERNQPATLVATVRLNPNASAYPNLFAAYGDWLATVCLICCMVLAIIGWRQRRMTKLE